MEYLPILFLEGVACLFKTSILKKFQDRGYEIKFGDFKEDTEKHPIYYSKRTNFSLDLMYNSKKFFELFETKFELCVRCPLSNYFYRIIFDILDESKSKSYISDWEEFSNDYLNKNVYIDEDLFLNVKRKILALVFLSKNHDLVVERMKERPNRIDILKREYVIVQNAVFRFMAKLLNWEIIEISGVEDIPMIEAKIENILKLLGTFKISTLACPSNKVIKYTSLESNILTRAYEKAAGIDLRSAYCYKVPHRGRTLINTGIKIQLPEGHYGRIASRSGLALKYGIDVGAGVVDEDYRGVIRVLLFNHSDEDFFIKRGDRVAQLICTKISYPDIRIDNLDNSVRGSGGFGSSDLN